MITKQGHAKCDSCGQFYKYEEGGGDFIPDSWFGPEVVTHFCGKCWKDIQDFRRSLG